MGEGHHDLGAGCDPCSQTVLEVCWKLPQSQVGAVVTAVVAGVVLVVVKLLNDKLRRHLPLPLPGELLTVRILGDRGEGQVWLYPCGRPPGTSGPAGVGTGESSGGWGDKTESPQVGISLPRLCPLPPAHWGHRHLLRRGPEAQIRGGCRGQHPYRVSSGPWRSGKVGRPGPAPSFGLTIPLTGWYPQWPPNPSCSQSLWETPSPSPWLGLPLPSPWGRSSP